MFEGILIALSGVLSGGIVAMYYRYKHAKQDAAIVGLRADIKSLERDKSDRDKILQADTTLIEKLKHDHAGEIARKDKLLEDKDADIKKHQAALKVLRARDPAAVAVALGSLFPTPKENGGGDKGSGESGGGSGHP